MKGEGPPSSVPPGQSPAAQPSTPNRTSRTIHYGPPARMLVLGMILFGAGGAFMVHKADGNDRGLILNGIIELSPFGATVFYCVISGVSFAFVAVALFLVPRACVRRDILLEADAITIPSRGLSGKVYRISRHDVRGVTVAQYGKMRYAKIYHAGGVRPINSTWLPNDDDLDTIVRWVQAAR